MNHSTKFNREFSETFLANQRLLLRCVLLCCALLYVVRYFIVFVTSWFHVAQITLPSKQGMRPEWNQPLLFTSNDTATIFTPNSALVIELYPSATRELFSSMASFELKRIADICFLSVMSSVTWSIRNPVGFCTVLLNDDVYRGMLVEVWRETIVWFTIVVVLQL